MYYFKPDNKLRLCSTVS